jgi:hypothetical protein
MVFMYLFLFYGYDIIITTICIINNFYLFYLLDTQVQDSHDEHTQVQDSHDEHRKYSNVSNDCNDRSDHRRGNI